jgi:hypothetical protein
MEVIRPSPFGGWFWVADFAGDRVHGLARGLTSDPRHDVQRLAEKEQMGRLQVQGPEQVAFFEADGDCLPESSSGPAGKALHSVRVTRAV